MIATMKKDLCDKYTFFNYLTYSPTKFTHIMINKLVSDLSFFSNSGYFSAERKEARKPRNKKRKRR